MTITIINDKVSSNSCSYDWA